MSDDNKFLSEECGAEAERSSGKRSRTSNSNNMNHQENVMNIIAINNYYRSPYSHQISEERLLYIAITIPDVNISKRIVYNPKAPPLLRAETLTITSNCSNLNNRDNNTHTHHVDTDGMHDGLASTSSTSSSSNGSNSNSNNVTLYVPTVRCRIPGRDCRLVLNGYKLHHVLAHPLPYELLVPQYRCTIAGCSYTCNVITSGASLPANVVIQPDVLAFGVSGRHVFFLERPFYRSVINSFLHHFNASQVCHEIHQNWINEWNHLQHEFQRARDLGYMDPGEDINKPNTYYGITLNDATITKEILMKRRQNAVYNVLKESSISKLFYAIYASYEAPDYIKKCEKIIHRYGSRFLCQDHTFRVVRGMHAHTALNHSMIDDKDNNDSENYDHVIRIHDEQIDSMDQENQIQRQPGVGNNSSKLMVKAYLSTIADLETGLILASDIVPNLRQWPVVNQLKRILNLQRESQSHRRTISLGVDYAVKEADGLCD